MDADQILSKAKAGNELPDDWKVFPILPQKLIMGIIGWIFGIILGFGLFALAAWVTIPYNFEHGLLQAIFTVILLGVFLFIGAGSIWTLYVDLQRIRQKGKHLIVITPDDFVMQQGDVTTHVPLMHVRYVTARGVQPPDRTVPQGNVAEDVPKSGEHVLGFFMGRGVLPSGMRWKRKRMRTPTTLAFIDSRTDKEVVVVEDKAFGDPFLIATSLKQRAGAVQQIV